MKVKVKFRENPNLNIHLGEDKKLKMGVKFSDTVVHEIIVGDVYSGPYSVTPSLYRQELPTLNNILTDNISIESIPTYEVSNDAGGETFVLVKGD